jgi:hypothetical protein
LPQQRQQQRFLTVDACRGPTRPTPFSTAFLRPQQFKDDDDFGVIERVERIV